MRRIRSSSSIAIVFVAVLAIPASAAASAAPLYVASDPADREQIHQAPERVEVTFTEPLDESSDLTIQDTCGRTLDDGKVQVSANTMSVGIKRRPSGKYVVSYAATGIGGITGTNAGGFQFKVHAGRPCVRAAAGNLDAKGGGGDKRTATGEGSGLGGGSGQYPAPMTGFAGSTTTTFAGAAPAPDAGARGGTIPNTQAGGPRQGGDLGAPEAEERNQPDGSTIASAAAGPFAPPDGSAALLALGLSLVLGVLGGWFLRMSGAR